MLAMFWVCEAIPTAWARMFMEKISAVQIQVVAPQEGLSVGMLDDKVRNGKGLDGKTYRRKKRGKK